MAICPKRVNLWFWSENDHFSNFLFLGNISKENVFYDILERKKAFLGYINQNSKSRKMAICPKRVNLWFWSENDHFSNFFFLSNIIQENVFYDILKGKEAFLGYKNKKF